MSMFGALLGSYGCYPDSHADTSEQRLRAAQHRYLQNYYSDVIEPTSAWYRTEAERLLRRAEEYADKADCLEIEERRKAAIDALLDDEYGPSR